MNRIKEILKVVALTLALALTLLGCGKKAQESEAVIVEPSETTQAVQEEIAVETVQGNQNENSGASVAETKSSEQKLIEATTPETTVAPTEEEVVLGDVDEGKATEATIPLEERPVVTTPAIQEEEDVPSDYENYLAMSGEEQQKFMQSFDSIEAFFEWYAAAKEEYESNKNIEISGDEVIVIN